jgi:hypothetical protein
MNKLALVAFVSFAATLNAAGIASDAMAASVDSVGWFGQNTQALYDAVAPGDKSPWERTLADDAIITDEDGEVVDKVKFLKDFLPLPVGFSGRIKVRDLTVHDLGAAAVVHYWLDEDEYVFGQTLKTVYVETDTYRRVGDAWKAVAMQITVVPRDLDAVQVDNHGWPALVGSYRLSDKTDRRYRVFLREGVLYAGSDEKSATRLIPLAPLVFFQKGSIHTMVFVQDAAGAVTEVREIHKYNEIVMTRVPASPR